MTTVTRYVGICPVCEGEYRLHRERMVHHGYKRPGHGSIQGDCPGVGFPPYEVSTEGTEHYLTHVHNRLRIMQAYLGQLQRGEIEILHVPDYTAPHEWGSRSYKMKAITVAAGYEFQQAIAAKIGSTESEIRGLQREAERCERLIREWRPRPIRTLEESVERESTAKAERAAVRDQARAEREAKKQATRDRVAAREKREADFIARYRTELTAAARAGEILRGQGAWKRMHREAKKEVSSNGRFFEALIELGLASITGNYLNYADESGWVPVARR